LTGKSSIKGKLNFRTRKGEAKASTEKRSNVKKTRSGRRRNQTPRTRN